MKDNYVLVYTGEPLMFFRGQNLYLGTALLTDQIDEAEFCTQDQAESYWNLMDDKDKWEIWTVKTGIVLHAKQNRHLIREKKEKLIKEFNRLSKEELL
jgi:hypothetical protein